MSDGKKVLLVDDDVDFVESNKDLLEAYGYHVFTAHDGAAGLELAKREKPDIMILDVMMATNTEGFEVARKIPHTAELKHMPILLVTGVRREMSLPFKVHPDETWLPVDKVFEKPIDPQDLLDEIKKRIG